MEFPPSVQEDQFFEIKGPQRRSPGSLWGSAQSSQLAEAQVLMSSISRCAQKSALSNCSGTRVANRRLSVTLSSPAMIFRGLMSLRSQGGQQLCAVNRTVFIRNNESNQSSRDRGQTEPIHHRGKIATSLLSELHRLGISLSKGHFPELWKVILC